MASSIIGNPIANLGVCQCEQQRKLKFTLLAMCERISLAVACVGGLSSQRASIVGNLSMYCRHRAIWTHWVARGYHPRSSKWPMSHISILPVKTDPTFTKPTVMFTLSTSNHWPHTAISSGIYLERAETIWHGTYCLPGDAHYASNNMTEILDLRYAEYDIQHCEDLGAGYG